MFKITSETSEPFSKLAIAASGLRPVFRVTVSPANEDELIVEVLTSRRRSHRVSQAAAPLDLPAELVFDDERSAYVAFRFHGSDVSVKALVPALKGARFKLVGS
ncbi:hypothetical protein ELH51_27360 [Rhizobium ruizarguesonis]|uniref:hypothetical protein n=1 Tax=Rhizobium ruizarguesonis TaxID=2081791 RepID=UPI00102FE95A|nr:hypothetical protein [Rhizobium ruizarguesonis]TBB25202.1 hypothetical protein ELH51_27360 [Rhizobium ruizarguesonis]